MNSRWAAIRAKRKALSNNPLVQNAKWSLLAEGTRLFAATGTFLILTRVFSTEEYGVLLAALALLVFALPFSSAGAGYLLLQRVAKDDWDPVLALRRATGTAGLGGLAATLLLVVLQPLILPQVPIGALAALGLGELVLTGMYESVLFLAQAQERIGAVAFARAFVGISRLAGALAMWLLVPDPALWMWALVVTVVAFFALLVGERIVVGHLAKPEIPKQVELREGFPFSFGFGADNLRESADQILLVRMNLETDAGQYGAGVRLIRVSLTPITSLIQLFNARFFHAAAESSARARQLAVKVSAMGLAITIPIGLVLAVFGQQVASVLPDTYGDTGTVLLWMSAFPSLIVLEIFPAMALTAIGRHRERVAFNLVTAAINVAIDVAMIPSHGWRAAVVSTYISTALYALVVWGILNHWSRPGRSEQQESSTLAQSPL